MVENVEAPKPIKGLNLISSNERLNIIIRALLEKSGKSNFVIFSIKLTGIIFAKKSKLKKLINNEFRTIKIKGTKNIKI